MSIASSASEDGWVPTVYDSVEKVKGTAENKRTVCCTIPYDASSRSVLMISSQKKPGMWTLPKGGKEEGEPYAEAALREAWEEGGILGYITSECICQIDTERNHVFFYPLQVSEMKANWPESGRGREWVSVEEAIERAYWRPEQAEALQHFSLWRDTLVESDTSNESSESGIQPSSASECTPSRLLKQLGSSVPVAGPLSAVRSYRFVTSQPPSSPAQPPASTATADSEPSPSSGFAEEAPTAGTSQPLTSPRQPVDLTVPEAAAGQQLLGSTAPQTSQRNWRVKTNLEKHRLFKKSLGSTRTEIGRLILAAAVDHRGWSALLTNPTTLTIAQKLEYLEDPALHGSPIPPGTSVSQWLAFLGQLGTNLNPKNALLRPPEDVRSYLLRVGVARILQHQQSEDPLLLLRLLELAQRTEAPSSPEVCNLLVELVKTARTRWWTADQVAGQPHLRDPQGSVALLRVVDSMRHRLLTGGIADAWDQTLYPVPVIYHRRRLFTFLMNGQRQDQSVAQSDRSKPPTVDYISAYLTSSAVQHPTDPLVVILLLKGYLSMAPSARGQAYFDAMLQILPDLSHDWTPEHRRSIREELEGCSKSDIEMYVSIRQFLRKDLEPYLGPLTELWRGVIPIPREIGGGVVSHADRSAALRDAKRNGVNLHDPHQAWDWNLERRPRIPMAERAKAKVEEADDETDGGATFALRPKSNSVF